MVAQLLKSQHLRHLALSGCAGVTDALWQLVEAEQLHNLRQRAAHTSLPSSTSSTAQAAAASTASAEQAAVMMDLDNSSPSGYPLTELKQQDSSSSRTACCSKLQSLNLVRCSNLRSLCLGLLPLSGAVELLSPKHYLIKAVHGAEASTDRWCPVESTVSELTSLKIGLSGLQVVALKLPKLIHLDLSSCKHLRVLELHCPLLLQLQLQACRSLPVMSAVRGVMCCPQLQMVDVQHMLPIGTTGPSTNAGNVRQAAPGGGEELHVSNPPENDTCGTCSVAPIGKGRVNATVEVQMMGSKWSPGMDLSTMLDEVAAAHASLKPDSILRCSSLCKVCSQLAHCSL